MAKSGQVKLQQIIGSLEKLSELAELAAPVIAKAAENELRRTISEGTDPYGEPWKLTLDGRVPLRNAMKAVRVVPVGRVAYIFVDGIEARHHLGAVRGKIRRRIIPSKKRLPPRMAQAIKLALTDWFDREVKQRAS